jgi:hypothetical protein
MSDSSPRGPTGAWEVFIFVASVAFGTLSAGILINEILRVVAGSQLIMDVPLSLAGRRILGTSLAAIGFAVSIAGARDRSAPEGARQLYLAFIFADLALTIGWVAFWIATTI